MKEVKAKAHSVEYALETLRSESVAPDHACVQFMVMHGVLCLNCGRRDIGGKTPYERRYGRRWTGKMAEFGERGMWLPEGQRASRLDRGYRAEISLGLVEGAAAYDAGVHEKIVKARAIQLLTGEERMDKEMFNVFQSTSWCLDPAKQPEGASRDASDSAENRGGTDGRVGKPVAGDSG